MEGVVVEVHPIRVHLVVLADYREVAVVVHVDAERSVQVGSHEVEVVGELHRLIPFHEGPVLHVPVGREVQIRHSVMVVMVWCSVVCGGVVWCVVV